MLQIMALLSAPRAASKTEEENNPFSKMDIFLKTGEKL